MRPCPGTCMHVPAVGACANGRRAACGSSRGGTCAAPPIGACADRDNISSMCRRGTPYRGTPRPSIRAPTRAIAGPPRRHARSWSDSRPDRSRATRRAARAVVSSYGPHHSPRSPGALQAISFSCAHARSPASPRVLPRPPPDGGAPRSARQRRRGQVVVAATPSPRSARARSAYRGSDRRSTPTRPDRTRSRWPARSPVRPSPPP